MVVGPKWLGKHRLPAVFLIEVRKGNVPGHSLLHVFGKADVSTTFVPIASSLKYPTPIAPTALEIISDNANDTAAGTGAREISLIGLNSSWEQITQAVATNGLTAVPVPIDMVRMYYWWISASGTYATSSVGSHAGIISIREASAGPLWFNGIITPYPKGQSEIAGFTVPVGFRAYVFVQSIVADSAKSVDVMFMKREGVDVVVAPFTGMRTVRDYVGVSDMPVGTDFNIPLGAFPAKTDLLFMGKVTSGTAAISVDYNVLLIEDGY